MSKDVKQLPCRSLSSLQPPICEIMHPDFTLLGPTRTRASPALQDGPAHLPLDPEAFHPWERIAGSAPGRSGRSTDRRRDAPAYHLVLCDPAAPRPLASVRFPPFERPTCVALWQPDAMPASSGTRTPVATGVRTGRAEAYEDFLDVGDDGYGGYRRLFTDTGLWRCVHDGAGRGDFTARGLRRSADEDSDDGMGEGDDERYSGVGTGSGSGGGVDDDGREVMDSGGSGDGSESAMSGDDSDMGPWGRPGVLGRTVGGDASGAGAGADGGWGASGAGAGDLSLNTARLAREEGGAEADYLANKVRRLYRG